MDLYFASQNAHKLAEIQAITKLKPMMVAEFATRSSDPGINSKPDWITDAFNKMKNNYTQIAAFNWFNTCKEFNWLIDGDPGPVCPAVPPPCDTGDPASITAATTVLSDPFFASTGDPASF